MARGSSSKVTAWTLDESVAAAADGAHIPGVPGLWRHGEAVSPEAFGMKVGEFEDLVERLGLPLTKVQVAEDKALTSFRRPDDPNRFESAPSRAVLLADEAVSSLETDEEARAQLANREVLEGTLDRVEAVESDHEGETG